MAKAGGFYATQAWRKCRDGYLKSVGGLCEVCLSMGMITPAEIVHHKIHLSEAQLQDPNIALSYKNLQALCRKHHAEQHPEIYKKKNPKRFTVDEYGRVTILPPIEQ